MKFLNIKSLLATILISFVVMIAFAQKLPATQKSSAYITHKIMVDGKASEINNSYQAYNRTTDLYYTLQNDDTRLYLIVNIKEREIIKKAIGGGITLSINATGKRNDPLTYSITFPQMYSSDKSEIAKNFNKLSELTGDAATKSRQADSINNLDNKLLVTYAKTIMLKKISSIPDSVISIYNEYGIKASVQFDLKEGLTYELIVPLKYVNLSTGSNAPFLYNIMLNGVLSTSPGVIKQTADGQATVVGVPRGFFNSVTYNDPNLRFPTDFWGEYKLATKP